MNRVRGVLVAAVCLAMTSCATITLPASYKGVAADDGIQGNATNRFAGFEFLRTVAFVPGKTPAKLFPRQRVSCASARALASVLWADLFISPADANQACRWVLQAVEYVAGYASDPRVSAAHYRLFLVPENQAAELRSFSWRPPGRLRPLYLSHWHANVERTELTIVGMIAHESLHLDMFLLGMREPLSEDEDAANLAGACAQLAVAGRIDRRNYQVGVPRTMNEFQDQQLNPSMMASGQFAAKISPLFNQNGLILADTKAGREFSKHCSEALTRLFGDSAD